MRPLALVFGICLGLQSCPAPAQRIQATPPRFTVMPRQKVNFGKVRVGRGARRWITIHNKGGGLVNVTWNPHPTGEFETNVSGTALSANSRIRFLCRFSPPDRGRYSTELVFQTDDPQRPEVRLLLTGVGYFRR